jgi:hypothetical protein
VATGKATALPHRFAGFFPPVGARPTLPAHGRQLFEIPHGSLYADGHIFTDRGVQRLTPWGARLLWSKIRAIGLAAGMFRRNGFSQVEITPPISGWYAVCSGRRMIHARVGTAIHPSNPKAPVRGRALARIDALFASAANWLPARAWADRTIRPYVPNHYDLSHDRMGPDPAKLPSPAREQLAKYEASGFEQGIPTDQARALIAAFVEAGVKPLPRSSGGELDFRLPIAHALGGLSATDSTILRVFKDPAVGGHNCEYPAP